MLIHQQNSYPPRSNRRTGRLEAQSREFFNRVKKFLCWQDKNIAFSLLLLQYSSTVR
jgi:hypothetical protein